MDTLRAAAPLARLLLTAGETRRDGDVLVKQRVGTARLSLAAGRLAALRGVDVEPLGDTLAALGALDLGALDLGAQRALLSDRSGAPIGARLIAAGATSAAAVNRALELQRWRGLSSLLRWPALRVQLVARGPSHARAGSLDLIAGVWSALFSLACELPASALAQLAGGEQLGLTRAGSRRVRALLAAGERGELARMLRLASSRDALAGPSLAPSAHALSRALAPRPPAELHAMRALLRVLGVALAPAERDDAYGLLLRKRRELAQNVSPRRLLDLPEQADADHARRALRRLAGKLHPDRFHASDARLHAVSAEVMGALARAEREVWAREVRELR